MSTTGSPGRQSAPFTEFEADSSRGWSSSADKGGSKDADQSERGARRAGKRAVEGVDGRRCNREFKDLKVERKSNPTSPVFTGDPDPQIPPERDGSWTLPSDIARQLAESQHPLTLIYQVPLFFLK